MSKSKPQVGLSRRPTRCRALRGFTLVELLVVIAIIGVLVALLLPAVQAAREASRRADCLNKLHQLGLAAQNYESGRKQLPPGIEGYDAKDPQVKSYAPSIPIAEAPYVAYILPYMEENALYQAYDFSIDVQDQYNTTGTAVGKLLPSFQCPSDEPQDASACSGNVDEDWKGNYGINWGGYIAACQRPLDLPKLDEIGTSQALCSAPRAMGRVAPFHIGFGAKFKQITDGLSNTLLMMELVQTEATGACDRRARIWCEKPGCYTVMTRNTPNTKNRDEGNCRADLLYAPCKDMTVGEGRTDSHNAARSRHPGGVNVALCDASVHFVSNEVDALTWRALGTMAGEEVFQSPF
jgi:prepilin-type N-terminal cleavage/methylation domain-containing protein/prepilin-type processing-associated H-X9-DG protein